MKLGPQNKDEATIFALEELRADIQYEMLKRLKQLGLSQAALAKRMGVSAAWVSQILDDDANLTLESISKVFLALGSKCHISALPAAESYTEVLWEHTLTERWHAAIVSTEIGRQEAAELIFVPERRPRASFINRPTHRYHTETEDCFEAA